jgi:outer membrane protein OmpA-like peptidoglycan-associated protein
MKTTNKIWYRSAVAVAVAAALFTGCASAPGKPAGSQEVRAKLIALQGDAMLATRAPVAMKEAEQAVAQAEIVQPDLVLAAHRVYIADRKVDSARALAETRFAEQERTALVAESAKSRLDARTLEADLAKTAASDAKTEALTARAESAEQKLATDQARSDANAAELQALELQRQVALLQARPTDRGLVLMLGDTLFATGRAELKPGVTADLDRVSAFLNEYPNRTAEIEGFTDSQGTEEYNQDLSQRRADSVKGYLVGQGVKTTRLSSTGRGENAPVADNASSEGRQQNRRVEVIISQGESSPKN